MTTLELLVHPDHPGLEAAASLIAENVILAFERTHGSVALAQNERANALTALMRALLAVMPTRSGPVLSKACNQALSALPGLEWSLARVEAVDVTDGSVTLRVP